MLGFCCLPWLPALLPSDEQLESMNEIDMSAACGCVMFMDRSISDEEEHGSFYFE